jgi:hypothetical protein
MTVKLRVCLLLALAAVSGACASSATGRPIDGGAAQALDDTPQTREDVRRQFGEPDEIEVNAEGVETWRYRYLSERYRGGPDATLCAILEWLPFRFLPGGGPEGSTCPPPMRTEQVLIVAFDPSGVIEDVAYMRREVLEGEHRRGGRTLPRRLPADPTDPVARNER